MFSILTVCTGNICRSPFAEQLLRARLGSSRFEISSAGTSALVGAPMPAEAIATAQRYGLGEASEHAGRQLTAESVRDANLVLALAREHRSAVVQLVPRASRYTFTLREIARIANAISDEDLRDEVDDKRNVERAAFGLLGQLRGMVPPPEHQQDLDVTDPYRRELSVYEESAEVMSAAVEALVDYVARAQSLARGRIL